MSVVTYSGERFLFIYIVYEIRCIFPQASLDTSSVTVCLHQTLPDLPCRRKIVLFMGRNLYILAGTLLVFAIISFGVSYTNIAQQPGSPGDTSLWRTMGLVLFFISMVVSLAAILSSLFEQAERHTEEERDRRRHKR